MQKKHGFRCRAVAGDVVGLPANYIIMKLALQETEALRWGVLIEDNTIMQRTYDLLTQMVTETDADDFVGCQKASLRLWLHNELTD